MSVFRHPKTQNERRADQALLNEKSDLPAVKGRVRSGKGKQNLPTERDDIHPASDTDKFRGKQTHSNTRKAAQKHRKT